MAASRFSWASIRRRRPVRAYGDTGRGRPPGEQVVTSAVQRSVDLLHRFLGIGLVLVSGAFVVTRRVGVAPATQALPAIVTYVFSGLALVLCVVSLIVLRGRIPARRSDQSVEEYWSNPGVGQSVLRVVFLF